MKRKVIKVYELKQGTARIVSALYNRKDNPAAIQRLAAALDYLPEQLEEDIRALNDFYQQSGREKKMMNGKEKWLEEQKQSEIDAAIESVHRAVEQGKQARRMAQVPNFDTWNKPQQIVVTPEVVEK